MSLWSTLGDIGKGLLKGGIVGAISAGAKDIFNKNTSGSGSGDSASDSKLNFKDVAVPIIDAGASIISTGIANQQNKSLTQQSWMRDDSAVQRRVKDLEAAGLSPILAAGSAAGNSSPISVKSADLNSVGDLIIKAVAQNDALATSAAQRALLSSQKNYYDEQTRFLGGTRTDYTNALTAGLVLDNEAKDAEKNHDYPRLRQIESAIKLNDAQLKALDLNYERDKYDFDFYRNRGYSSKGPQSIYGKISQDLTDNIQNGIRFLLGR